VKRIIKKGEGVDLMTHLDMEGNLQNILPRSDDFKEGVQVLMEGRTPDWKRMQTEQVQKRSGNRCRHCMSFTG
jgi:hypothetical protein